MALSGAKTGARSLLILFCKSNLAAAIAMEACFDDSAEATNGEIQVALLVSPKAPSIASSSACRSNDPTNSIPTCILELKESIADMKRAYRHECVAV
jgi:hypothetical protein